jgi:hypothetical protein
MSVFLSSNDCFMAFIFHNENVDHTFCAHDAFLKKKTLIRNAQTSKYIDAI